MGGGGLGVVGWTDGLGGLQVVQQVAVEGLRGSATMHSAVQLIPVHAFTCGGCCAVTHLCMLLALVYGVGKPPMGCAVRE